MYPPLPFVLIDGDHEIGFQRPEVPVNGSDVHPELPGKVFGGEPERAALDEKPYAEHALRLPKSVHVRLRAMLWLDHSTMSREIKEAGEGVSGPPSF